MGTGRNNVGPEQIEGPSGNIAEVTVDNCLMVCDQSSGFSIAQGNVTGVSFIHKFGEAPDFDTGDNKVTVWDGANDGGIDQMTYIYSSSADIDSLVSNDNGDTQDIEILGLDTTYAEVVQTVTLTGQTRVALGTNLIRVYRMVNSGSTDLAGTVSCYVNSSDTNGNVDDSTKVRAIINNGNNQTLMSIYTVPLGKTAYLEDFFASVVGANKSGDYVIEVYARPFGGVFQLKHKSAVNEAGSTHIQHKYGVPEIFVAKTDIELRVSISTVGVSGADITGGFDFKITDD